jgi:hypothetical protein
MNKEVIKKYKDVFDHWLDGGSILCRRKNNPKESWNEIKEPLWLDAYLYTINDEYVEFRLALAEGKTIQVVESKDKWVDYEIGTPFYQIPENYRIKPDESNFAVGDWVRHPESQSVYQINSLNIVHGTEHFELWTPQPNEWCWVWDDSSYAPYLDKFQYMINNKFGSGIGGVIDEWEYCEPFIGTLPTGCTK